MSCHIQNFDNVKTKFQLHVQVCTKKKQLPPPESRTATSFLRCLAVQMTLYVQQLTLSSMADFDKFVLSLDADVKHQPAGWSYQHIYIFKRSKYG